ncbi:hypothetical protein RHMOL_Rhmol03G0083300 [Rhododendron molle]|uniref:Uncharacterized protein n=1 Tax=Rhododendron molle TaxID=49168 RepID=A0ACC0PBW3_RHOML|nr:hypothetical protein RHMOL_Rhmol03G0083300 [Rhododendron molle]
MKTQIGSTPTEPKKTSISNEEQMTETQVKKQANESEDDEAESQTPVPGRIRTQASTASETARERLKRHRVEVAGRVWIPELWGQEELLKDWIDCTVFDASLRRSNIMSARAALVEEGRRVRANSSGLRIENRC